MKVWVKLLIGSVLGLVIGFLLPENSQTIANIFQWLEKLALGIGRYAVVPVLVFSLTIAVYKLRMEEQFWPAVFKNILFLIFMSLFVITTGLLVTLFFSPGRIPIEKAEQFDVLNLDVSADIIDIFPSNMLSVLAGDGVYLFPFCAFAFFLGMGLNYDRNYSKTVITMIDSLSRVFYHVASFFTEILGFILIVLAAYWAVRYNGLLASNVYKNLVIMLGAFSVILCFGVFPLLLYLVKPRANPWLVLYGSLGPALCAFFSGDFNFTIPVMQRHLKENFGVRRRSSSVSISLFAAFCRGGSAMAAAVAFVVIIKSYSYLSIAPAALLSIGLRAFAVSFMLARHPGDGAYIALTALCLGYSGGEYRAGYLILKPLAFYLVAIGTFIDVMISSFGTYLLAKVNGHVDEKNPAHFI